MTLRLIPYLVLDGKAEQAIAFYEKTLGAQRLFSQTFGEMPENPEFPLPEESKGRIGHASIRIGETDLMLSDTFPGQPHRIGDQVTICLSTDDAGEAKRMFHALEDGGEVKMPLQETHFSPAYGMVTDKFGITFHIYTDARS